MRLALVAALAAALTSFASVSAQSPTTVLTADTEARDAGILDWATGTWRRGNNAAFANAVGAKTIYNNTCTFTGGGGVLFADHLSCWDRYEEGRIPTDDPGDPSYGLVPPSELCECYFLCGFTFGYCTSELPGTVDIQLGFLEGAQASGLGGDCMNVNGTLFTPNPPSGAPGGFPKPPGNFNGPNDLYFDLGNVGLPGSSGGTTCWTITIDLSNNANGGLKFCGNGGANTGYDGSDADKFIWVWSQRGNAQAFGPTGPMVAGDPGVAPPGSATFGLGGPCGTGLGAFDGSWINTDGQPVGTTGAGSCAPQGPNGSYCYSFGGWPNFSFSDLMLTLHASPVCESGGGQIGPIAYCSGKQSSSGCITSLSTSNPDCMPDSGAGDYAVLTNEVEGFKNGILFFGVNGPTALPFQGGTLCVFPPLGRTPVQNSGGSFGGCDGSYCLFVNDGGATNPLLDQGPGTSNWLQAWYRDPAQADGTGTALSNALQLDFMLSGCAGGSTCDGPEVEVEIIETAPGFQGVGRQVNVRVFWRNYKFNEIRIYKNNNLVSTTNVNCPLLFDDIVYDEVVVGRQLWRCELDGSDCSPPRNFTFQTENLACASGFSETDLPLPAPPAPLFAGCPPNDPVRFCSGCFGCSGPVLNGILTQGNGTAPCTGILGYRVTGAGCSIWSSCQMTKTP